MGSSKKVTVGYWFKLLYHAGLSKGPIDAFLEFRGGDKTAWKGGLTASGTININQPKLWGGEKDQGGIVSDVDVMFGESTQAANAYLLANLGAQVPAWRGLATLVFKGGKYGAMNPYPQKASYKIRRILHGWDGGAAWYPETAEITLVSGSSGELTFGGGPSFPSELVVEIGSAPGTIQLVYATGPNPDKFEVWYDGVKVIDTGYHGTGGALSSGGITFQEELDNFLVSQSLPTETIIEIPGSYVDASAQWASVVDRETASFEKATATPTLTLKVYGPLSDTFWIAEIIGTGANTLLAMNPAHVLYYARTDADLGREPVANIDDASLRAAADTLFAEGFGICTTHDPAQESVEEFEQRIAKLIDGSFSRDPITGLWHLDLSRGDYVLEELPVLADDDILEFRELPSTLDNAINSVSVTYFDPERKESVTTPPVQARGLIQDFGTIHQTIEYPEIPTASLAARVALRELRATATPTRAFDLVCTRKPFAWRPNTYFRLQAPKRGIADMVCIVGEKESGNLKSGAIRLKAAQDIYSMPDLSFVEVEPGVDTGPSQIPLPITLQAAFEAPYIELVSTLSRADMDVLPADAGYVLAVAADPAASRDYTMMVDAGAGYTETANGDWCPTATVVAASSWLDTAFTLAGGTRLDEVVVGSAALWENEIVRVDAINPTTGAITLGRACADTLPAQHAAGSRIWFYQDNEALDPTEYTAGEGLDIKLLTNTGSQQIDIALATAMSVGMGGRQVLPYPPANLRINSAYYPVALTGNPLITIDWAHRDRVLQADQLIDFLQGNIGPEPGTTYNLRLYGEADTLLRTETGLTGTTYTWSAEDADSGLTVPGALANAYSAFALALSPAALYMMDEAVGTSMVDASPNANHGTYMNGAVPTSPGLMTEGTTSLNAVSNLYATAPGAVAAALTGFSIVLWVQWSHSGNRVICERNANAGYSIQTRTDGRIGVTSTEAGTARVMMQSSVAINNGLPHCVVFVFGPTPAASKIYVDGEDLTSITWATVAPSYGSSTVWDIGKRPAGSVMDGRLDGIVFVGSELTLEQAAELNAAGRQLVSRLNSRVRFELESVRGGLVSRQKNNITVDRAGYGYQYGNYYGGI